MAGAYLGISIKFVKKIEMCDLKRFTQCGNKASSWWGGGAAVARELKTRVVASSSATAAIRVTVKRR